MVTRKRFVPPEGLVAGVIGANLVVLMILYSLVLFDLYPSARQYLLTSVEESRAESSFALSIEETGNSYQVAFRGGFFPEGDLSGTIEEMETELYMQEGKLFVSADESKWLPVEELEMEAMYALLYDPLQMVSEMASVPGASVSYGPSENLAGILVQKVNIVLPANAYRDFYHRYFALEHGNPRRMAATAWVDCENHTLVRLHLYLTYEHEGQQLEIFRRVMLVPGGAVPVINFE